jgi:signal transduction histidine kinase
MLRNTRIRTRLAMMAIAPVIPVLVVLGLVAAMLPNVMITGPTYDQIISGEKFVADSSKMRLEISRVHVLVQRLSAERDKATIRRWMRAEIATHWRDYTQLYNSWEGRLTDNVAHGSLTDSHEAALEYYRLYTEQFLPAVDKKSQSTGVDPAEIMNVQMTVAMTRQDAALARATARVEQRVAAQEKIAVDQLPMRIIGVIGVTLLVVAAGIGLSMTVLRSITSRVRRLNDVATVELPRVLETVKRAALAGEEIPSLPAPRNEGRDELTDAASAFNSVVATAVSLAADQSRLRRSTSQMFVNLGRRNHKLLSRTLTYITQLESDERDPGTLQNLFRLDHLTTRMRRQAESLLVLAGSPPLRTWSRPVPVADVLRAALSEIETYDRVDVKELEPVEVRGASVSDLAHLLAELLENATAFSPPQTRVRVLGRTDTDGYTIVVVDEGIGMSAQELDSANQLINTPDDSGFLGDSRMLGLGVVGRLASRHRFKVSLTASPVGGVVAWVTLPTTALAPRRGVEAQPMGTPMGGGAQAPADGLPRQAAYPTSSGPTPAPRPATPPPPPAVVNGRSQGAGDAPSALPMRHPARDRRGDADESRRPETVAGVSGPPQPQGSPDQVPPVSQDRQAPRSPATSSPAPPTGGQVIIPPVPERSPVSGPIAFRRPPAGPSGAAGLTRRVRGAQLPETGDPIGKAQTGTPRPQRSAQSVRGALQSFTAGRRTASEVTLGNAQPMTGPTPVRGAGPVREDDAPTRPQPMIVGPLAHPEEGQSEPYQRTSAPSAEDAGGRPLPRRVRGAQMPQTDLPTSAPAPGRTAAEVRAALSNFVAGRRAAEHED